LGEFSIKDVKNRHKRLPIPTYKFFKYALTIK